MHEISMTCFLLFATCFMLVSCLAYSSTLKMEATYFSETSVDFQRTDGVKFQKLCLFNIGNDREPLNSTKLEL
jgi:hypothetical protein